MRPPLIDRIRRTVNDWAGYDVVRYRDHPNARLMQLFHFYQVTAVLDIGANRGMYARRLRRAGYSGEIYSFEPLPGPFSEMEVRRSRTHDERWHLTRTAVGSHRGELALNVAANHGESSSAMPMLAAHVDAAPHARYVGTQVVPVGTLDELVHVQLSAHAMPFVKIDVQGFEHEVLAGATETLRRAVGLQVELSIVPLYEGQHLYLDMIQEIQGLGFSLAQVEPAFVDERSGRTLQIDGIFFRPDDAVGID